MSHKSSGSKTPTRFRTRRARALRSRAYLTVVAVLVAGALLGSTASVAQAWYPGNVYLVVSNAHCFAGGSIVYMQGAVDTMWTGGDWGDNILYPRVRIGDTNQYNGYAYCSRPWYQGGTYRIYVLGRFFRPSYNGQTIWL